MATLIQFPKWTPTEIELFTHNCRELIRTANELQAVLEELAQMEIEDDDE